MIRTENLNKRFGEDRGVFDLNLHVPKGSIYGFVGHNGAGKTTTIKILCGLLKPDSGKAFISDVEVTPSNFAKIKQNVGYMPDIYGVYEQMSVWEYLDFYGAAFKIPKKNRKARIEEVLEITNATHMIDYQVSSLSRGMGQRIGLAKTLIHDPELLILDEPAGGLDPNARIEMRHTIRRLKELGKTILLSSHILPELATVCDQVGIISKGVLLAQGTVKEISEQMQENITIEVVVDSDPTQASQILEAVNLVESVKEVDHNQLHITYAGPRDNVGEVLSYIMQQGVKVRWFAENEANLEDVFMDITNK